MENSINVLIAIQARSHSTRFPRKCLEMIGDKCVLDHVIINCNKSLKYLTRSLDKRKFIVNKALLIPYDDALKLVFDSKIDIIEGPESDVLTRLGIAQNKYNADYICRVNGDCPMIPPYVMSKHISIAANDSYDYVSNIDEQSRLSIDGVDCEVMSKRMLEWLVGNTSISSDREDVTIKARTDPPQWAKRAFTAGYFDLSNLKYSIDTQDDLERVKNEYENVGKKLQRASKNYGRENVYRF